MNWNPFKKKNPIPHAYVTVDPTAPHVGLSVFSEGKTQGASICVEGITLAQARIDLCGKVLDWDRIPPAQVNSIMTGNLTVSLDSFKSLFK